MEGTKYIVSDGRIRTESEIGWLLGLEQKKRKVAANGTVSVMKFCDYFRIAVTLVSLFIQ